MMKLLLIKPSYFENNGKLFKTKKGSRIELTLPLLAALTPSDVEVKILDETIDDIDFNADVDLIGITSMTRNINRAYQIADEFKSRGKTVIMGGIHVTFCPKEASKHCNAVVIGEAESVLCELLSDFKKGKLKTYYENKMLPDLKNIPSPRFDLLNLKKYLIKVFPVQATRGCYFECEFCAVSQFFKGKVRSRPIESVLRDINSIKKLGGKRILFVDENIIADHSYAKELFRALIPLNINWMGQTTIHITGDSELLDLASKSGCFFLEIGFETINEDNLRNLVKSKGDINEYVNAIKILRKKKIIIGASMIFGFDYDNDNIFEKTLRFLQTNKIPIFDSYILTPGPGTELLNRLEKEMRITSKDWSRYNGKEIVFKPKQITSKELKLNFWKTARKFYSLTNLCTKVLQTPLQNLLLVLFINIRNWLDLRRRNRYYNYY